MIYHRYLENNKIIHLAQDEKNKLQIEKASNTILQNKIPFHYCPHCEVPKLRKKQSCVLFEIASGKNLRNDYPEFKEVYSVNWYKPAGIFHLGIAETY